MKTVTLDYEEHQTMLKTIEEHKKLVKSLKASKKVILLDYRHDDSSTYRYFGVNIPKVVTGSESDVKGYLQHEFNELSKCLVSATNWIEELKEKNLSNPTPKKKWWQF